jgi:hypothetical protein
MTKRAVADGIKSIDGDVLTVKYKDGEKRIIVTPETSIVRFEPGDRSELREGTKIVATVSQNPDGTGKSCVSMSDAMELRRPCRYPPADATSGRPRGGPQDIHDNIFIASPRC